MQKVANNMLDESLKRLIVCNRIRELSDNSSPVTVNDLKISHGILGNAIRIFPDLDNVSGKKNRLFKNMIVYLFAFFLLRLLLWSFSVSRSLFHGNEGPKKNIQVYKLSCLQELIRVLKGLFRRVMNGEASVKDVAGYVLCAEKEDPLIRVSLLLRIMGRYSNCIQLLIQRLNSGLPSMKTRQLLSFYLHEIEDIDASRLILSSLNAIESKSTIKPQISSRFKYGIVITVMFDSDVFRSSLTSLLKSDYSGQIVVVEEGNRQEKVCEAFCKQLPVTYVKNSEWSGVNKTIMLGVEQLEQDTDIVIYSHSDVLWSPNWFGQLNNVWEKVFDLGKVGIINLGYLQFRRHNVDPVLYELFIKGRYEDLCWAIDAMRELPRHSDKIQNVQIKNGELYFGLAIDPWTNSYPDLRMMTGRFSVGASFPLRTLRDAKTDPDMSIGMDVELEYYCLSKKMWSLWINNSPLIHLVSADTKMLSDVEKYKYDKDLMKTNALFIRNYGWDVEHFLSTYFSESCIIYYDEIVSAANELRFADIDFIFDDFFKRFKNKKLSSCELVWCRSRGSCICQ